jgi:hypothetical protein
MGEMKSGIFTGRLVLSLAQVRAWGSALAGFPVLSPEAPEAPPSAFALSYFPVQRLASFARADSFNCSGAPEQ